MLSDQGSDQGSEDAVPPAEAQSDWARRGRRAGFFTFWVLVLAVALPGSLSIIGQTLLPATKSNVPRERERVCEGTLRELRDDVLRFAASDQAPEALAPSLRTWDNRYLALGPGCGQFDRARVDIHLLRDKVERVLERAERQLGPLRDRIEQDLSTPLAPAGPDAP